MKLFRQNNDKLLLYVIINKNLLQGAGHAININLTHNALNVEYFKITYSRCQRVYVMTRVVRHVRDCE